MKWALSLLAAAVALRADENFPIVSPEYEVQLFAQEPLVRNPCALAFDAKGRLSVGMGPQYRNPTPETPGDSVYILIDADGDGRAESRKEFATGFNCIQGLAWKGGALWVANAPDLTVARDIDGDDVADEYVRLYTDLGNLEHGLHGLNWAPDGKLYMSKGNSKGLTLPPDRVAPKAFRELWGVDVEGLPEIPAPVIFKKGEYRRNYHDPADDWGREGGILRCDADGRNLEIVARGFRNPWDICFDDAFNWLGTDNDQTSGDKIFAPFYGAHFGWGHPWSFDWSGENHLPTAPANGPFFEGSGAGVIFLGLPEHPENYRGVFLINDWLRREVLVYRPKWDGARMVPERTPLEVLASAGAGRSMERSHGRKFDPVDIEIGPDAAIYISSWGRSYGVETRAGEMINEGRVYRISPKGARIERPSVLEEPIEKWPVERLIARLGSHLPVWRADAQEELVRRGATGPLAEALKRPATTALQTWAAWTLGRIRPEDPRLSSQFVSYALASDADPNLRLQALRILAHRRFFGEPLLPLLRSDVARLRFETVLAMRQARWVKGAEPLESLLAGETDRLVFYAAWGALRELASEEHRRSLLKRDNAGVRLGALLGLLEADALSASELREIAKDADERVSSLARQRLAGKSETVIRGRPLISSPPPSPTGDRATIKEVLAHLSEADPRRGRELFMDANAAGCVACHRLEGVGNVFAPDLTGLGLRADAEFIARSIIEPSAAITEGFSRHDLVTKDGDEFSGLLLEETAAALKLALASGATVIVPAALIERREASRESAMPGNYADILNSRQVADLVAYLRQAKAFELRQEKGQLHVIHNGIGLGAYVFEHEQLTRPALVNVRTLRGTLVTRSFPADGTADHRWMHPGISVSFGWLDGHDYWRGKAQVRHAGFIEAPKSLGDAAGWTARNEYVSEDGTSVVCLEDAKFEFRATADGLLLLLESEFYNNERDFVFGDQEESGLCVRIDPQFAVRGGSGAILNDRGEVNEAGIWGKEFAWIDYSGVAAAKRAGLLIVPHPANPRPSWAHVRDYGVLVANPFPRQPREQKEPVTRTVVKRGERFRLRWSVLVYER